MTTVLYTGGEGCVGRVVRAGLAEQFKRVVLYSRESISETHPREELRVGELDDLPRLYEAMRDVDVVIHLAAVADKASWDEIFESNFKGTHAVFETARRAGVRRVIYASSHHAIGFYPAKEIVGTVEPVRPDSYYGVSKVFGEALARYYHDKWGLEAVCLRIGAFRPEPEDMRHLSVWLSHQDGIELVHRSIVADAVGYTIVYGVSANSRSWWNNDAAATSIGYCPRDNAEDYRDKLIPTSHLPPLHGGIFADPEYLGGI